MLFVPNSTALIRGSYKRVRLKAIARTVVGRFVFIAVLKGMGEAISLNEDSKRQ